MFCLGNFSLFSLVIDLVLYKSTQNKEEMMNLTRLEWGGHIFLQTVALISLVAEIGKEGYKDLLPSHLKNRRKRYWYDCGNEPQVL